MNVWVKVKRRLCWHRYRQIGHSPFELHANSSMNVQYCCARCGKEKTREFIFGKKRRR